MLDNLAKLGVRMHGVTMTLESNHPPLISYAAQHLHVLAEPHFPDPDFEVTCQWTQGDWGPEENPFASDGALNTIGKRMLGQKDELIWLDTLRMKGLQLRFHHEQKKLRFEVAYKFHPKKEKIDSLPEYEYKKYFSLMSYLVYYPLMWHLESLRGWTVVHASALSSPAGGILIGGLGGVGKTTTCIALLRHAGIQLMSENLVFTDGEFVYPCYEPIRLDGGSLNLLGDHPRGLSPMVFPEGLKDKSLFHISQTAPPEKVRPAALFLPQFSPKRYLTPLAPELAAEKILAMNRLTREVDDYGWYAAALSMHWPQAGRMRNRIEVVHRFAERVRCFELGIDRSAEVETVVKDILSAVQEVG